MVRLFQVQGTSYLSRCLCLLTLSEVQSADRGSLRGRRPFNEVLTENR